jgi:hypothetical protein
MSILKPGEMQVHQRLFLFFHFMAGSFPFKLEFLGLVVKVK